MRRPRLIFLTAIILLAAWFQFLLTGIQIKISSFDKFMNIKTKLERVASFSCGTAPVLNNLSEAEDTIILQLPATNSKYEVIPDSFDYVAVIYKNNTLSISLFPGFLSARQHESIYFRSLEHFRLGFMDNLFSCACSINGNYFYYNFFINKNLYLISHGQRGEVL